jgi:2-iminobutanoate/2-iminopropanoate deaminase
VKKQPLNPENHWDWSMPMPFVQGWAVEDAKLVFVGGQISSDAKGQTIGVGDIAAQTRNVFNSIRAVLNEAGADMKDIVKLNTYYVFDGADNELTQYWEDMTTVRLEFFKESPGPCGTGIRVAGLAYPDLLIEVEAIAVVPKD